MPLRERTWLDGLLDAPLPETPAQLLAECQELRRRLIDRKWTAAIVSRAPEVTERLWDAMRCQGGAVPPRPPLQACSEAAAWADLLLDKEAAEPLHRAVDAVAAWCEGRGAVGATGGAPAGAARPEGDAQRRRKRRGRPADTDPNADKRIYEAWQTGRYKDYAGLALEMKTTKLLIQQAIDRERKRRK